MMGEQYRGQRACLLNDDVDDYDNDVNDDEDTVDDDYDDFLLV